MTEPVTPTGEPEVKPEVGTAVTPAPSDTPVEDKGTDELAKLQAELENIRKEKLKAEMRANQLENQSKEKEAAELKEKEDYKALAEKYEADLAQIKADQEAAELAAKEAEEAAEAQKQLTDFREKVIDAYPENVQAAARKLIEKNPSNLLWKDAKDWEDAEAQLTDQLNELAEVLGETAPAPKAEKQPKVSGNNPSGSALKADPNDLTWEEMRKVLPHAEER